MDGIWQWRTPLCGLCGLLLAAVTLDQAEPVLQVEAAPGELHLSWTETVEAWTLESCPDPAVGTGWSVFPHEAEMIAGRKTVVVPAPVAPVFWRLQPLAATLVAIVKDAPDPLNPLEFSEIPPAFDYLHAHLGDDQTGEVWLETDRALKVDRLEFHRPIILRIAEGFNPTLVGPEDGRPLQVEATAPCGLVGLAVEGTGGLAINALDDLLCRGNQAAQFAIQMGTMGAMARGAAPRDGAIAQRVYEIMNNASAGPLNLTTGSNLDATLDASGNQAKTLTLAMQGYVRGELNLSANLVDSLSADLRMTHSLTTRIEKHVDLERLDVDALADGGTLELEANEGIEAALTFDGAGSLLFRTQSQKFEHVDWGIGASLSRVEVNLEDDEYLNHRVTAGAEVLFNAENITVTGSADYAWDAGIKATLFMTGIADYRGSFTSTFGGDVSMQWEDFMAKGVVQWTVEGDLFEADIQRGRFDTIFSLETKYVSSGFYLSVGQGGPRSHAHGMEISLPPISNRHLSMTGCDVQAGGYVLVYLDELFGGERSVVQAPALAGIETRAAGGGFTFRDLKFQGPEGGAPAIALSELTESITIEDCNFKGSITAVSIGQSSGQITIKNNQFQDGGITIMDCPGNITISGNEIDVSQPPGALTVGTSGDVSLTGNSLRGTGAAFSIFATADVNIDANGNEIDGNVFAGGGEELPSRIALSGNTFTPHTMVLDGTGRSGGLPKDPMGEGNSGLIPGFINSLIDFDGNGCADYPPEGNEKKPPEYTECVTEGIGPP